VITDLRYVVALVLVVVACLSSAYACVKIFHKQTKVFRSPHNAVWRVVVLTVVQQQLVDLLKWCTCERPCYQHCTCSFWMHLQAQISLHCRAAAVHKCLNWLLAVAHAGLVYMAMAKHPWLLTTKHGTTT